MASRIGDTTQPARLRITWVDCLACVALALGLSVAALAIVVWWVLT